MVVPKMFLAGLARSCYSIYFTVFHVEQKEGGVYCTPRLSFCKNRLFCYYLPNFINNTLMSAGETPGIRDA